MGYTPEWWAREKDRINAKRNARYQNDPEYREAARKRAREYRERKKKEREAAKANPTIEINGQQRPALTTFQVCEHAGVTAARIKYMQRVGYLPPALVTRPVRLYTKKQADLIRKLENFLREHKQSLRGPATPETEKVLAKLEKLKSTIAEKWET